jgi:hypothetical protein
MPVVAAQSQQRSAIPRLQPPRGAAKPAPLFIHRPEYIAKLSREGHRARKDSAMTPSPRSFSSLSFAVIVFSLTLSVLMSPALSFAQSSTNPHAPYTHLRSLVPPSFTNVACDRKMKDKCVFECEVIYGNTFPVDDKRCKQACTRQHGC